MVDLLNKKCFNKHDQLFHWVSEISINWDEEITD